MKLDSIKYRLLLITAICLLGMALVVVNQLYFAQKLKELNQQSSLLQVLNIELMLMRQQEKDFLLSMDTKYVSAYQQQADLFEQHLPELQQVTAEYALPGSLVANVASSFEVYQLSFYAMVELQQRIGLHENSGDQGRFRRAIHALEGEFFQLQQLDWQLQLLQLRRSEKDFMLRKQYKYVERAQNLYQQLNLDIQQSSVANKHRLLELLDDYIQGMMSLVSSYQKLGLKPVLGLQGELAISANQVELLLKQVQQRLQPTIIDEQQRIQRNGLLIMLTTALLLIVLLVRSFMTFQRAFSNFIMFFYRCKRDYQYIDEKQLGFAEFKSLAGVANEMVDSRQETERKLAMARKEVEKLKQRSG